MSQIPPSLTSPKVRPARTGASSHPLGNYSPWLTLALAPFEWLCSSGIRRTLAEIRCLRAIGEIDFASLYGKLNDLLL